MAIIILITIISFAGLAWLEGYDRGLKDGEIEKPEDDAQSN